MRVWLTNRAITAGGKAYKYFPLKITFLLLIFIFKVGSLICGVAPNSEALIVGRAIVGVGAGGIGLGAYTLIAYSAPPRRRLIYCHYWCFVWHC